MRAALLGGMDGMRWVVVAVGKGVDGSRASTRRSVLGRGFWTGGFAGGL